MGGTQLLIGWEGGVFGSPKRVSTGRELHIESGKNSLQLKAPDNSKANKTRAPKKKGKE